MIMLSKHWFTMLYLASLSAVVGGCFVYLVFDVIRYRWRLWRWNSLERRHARDNPVA